MTAETNPRKIGETATMNYVSIPDGFMAEVGLEHGDRVVLQETENGFEAVKVEWRTA